MSHFVLQPLSKTIWVVNSTISPGRKSLRRVIVAQTGEYATRTFGKTGINPWYNHKHHFQVKAEMSGRQANSCGQNLWKTELA
jgi:hypothetical protein